MSKYLSQEWLDEFRTLAADLPARAGATVRIQYRATGGPDGDVDYYWVVDEGRITEAARGTLEDADFTMTTTYDDAAKMQRGDLDPQAAFMQGKMRVTGNMAKMMALMPITTSAEWKAFESEVRAVTDF